MTTVDDGDVVVRYADPGHHAEQVSVWAHLSPGKGNGEVLYAAPLEMTSQN